MGLWAVPHIVSDWFCSIWARYTIRRAKVSTLSCSNWYDNQHTFPRCSYLSIGVYHDNQHTFPHLIVPCTWHTCNRRSTPRHIRWVSGQSNKACRIESVAFGHATQLGELRIPHCHTPTGSDLCITGHWNVVIRLAWCCFYIFRQNLVIITWGTWYVCQIFNVADSRAV